MNEEEKRQADERKEGKVRRGTTGEGEMDRVCEILMDEDEGDFLGEGKANDHDVDISREDDGDNIHKQKTWRAPVCSDG